MAVPSPDTKIVKLGYPVSKQLRLALEEDDAWRSVADRMNLIGSGRLRISKTRSPVEDLLGVLTTQECTVEVLCRYLRVCRLYNVLAVLTNQEALVITHQPDTDGRNICVDLGKTLTLRCEAKGIPGPIYSWFWDNKQLEGQTTSQLIIHNFTLEKQGCYYCSVTQKGTSAVLHSHEVEVNITPILPRIVVQPEKTICQLNSTHVVLHCRAEGHPTPSYQWYHNNTLLQHCNTSELKIQFVTDRDEGEYRCLVENAAGEVFSQTTTLKTFKTYPDDVSHTPLPKVSIKIALLIGNTNYDMFNTLNTPWRDVMTLAKILKKKGFLVLALKDLTLVEMRSALRFFCQLLCRASYGVFYFAGHGFEVNHHQYMMPVEAPHMSPATCLSVKEVVHCAQKKMPHLILVIPDMCLITYTRKKKQDCPQDFRLSKDKNIIIACSTTSGHKAYECDGEANGEYMTYLNEYLSHDMPIEEVLRRVRSAMPGEQSPMEMCNVDRSHVLSVPAEGDFAVEELYKKVTAIKDSHMLVFPEVKQHCQVSYHPLYTCFLNALQIVFHDIDVDRWDVRCELPAFQELSVVEEQGSKDHVTVIHNLQKAKLHGQSQLSLLLTVKLLERQADGSSKEVSNVIIDLGYPLVTIADLWHDAPSCNCRACYKTYMT